MKLASSTGDFSFYVKNITEKIENFEGRKFKYINLDFFTWYINAPFRCCAMISFAIGFRRPSDRTRRGT